MNADIEIVIHRESGFSLLPTNIIIRMISFFRSWLFTATLSFFTFLFLVPQSVLVGDVFDWWDKAQHAIAFSVLCATGFWSHPNKATGIFWLLIVYGGVIEILQSFTGWRQGDWQDWVADSSGVLICYIMRSLIGDYLQQKAI